jgi:LAO/AO transport system kinase
MSQPIKRRRLKVEDYVQGVLEKNRTILAQAITLVESNLEGHMKMAQEVLQRLQPHTGRSIRIGITGVPGAGKSTFIEAFGLMLCEKGHRVAVLAIDPSSTLSKGSILGDKTRMEKLSKHPDAYIRPSASGGTLGGVARKTRESMLVCEAAGFDVILIETVGVGQSEVAVRSMVDFFLLVTLTGAGDDLQGIKKGIIELADAILINKADGDNQIKAMAAKMEFNRVLHYLHPATEGWTTQAYTCSALYGNGMEEIWEVIREFQKVTTASGIFHRRRQQQTLDWIYTMIDEYLRTRFFQHQIIQSILPQIEKEVLSGRESATQAFKRLVHLFEEQERG